MICVKKSKSWNLKRKMGEDLKIWNRINADYLSKRNAFVGKKRWKKKKFDGKRNKNFQKFSQNLCEKIFFCVRYSKWWKLKEIFENFIELKKLLRVGEKIIKQKHVIFQKKFINEPWKLSNKIFIIYQSQIVFV